jgi:hypothetical protein
MQMNSVRFDGAMGNAGRGIDAPPRSCRRS